MMIFMIVFPSKIRRNMKRLRKVLGFLIGLKMKRVRNKYLIKKKALDLKCLNFLSVVEIQKKKK